MTHGKRRRERICVWIFCTREESREMCVRFRERNDARERELFLSKLLCLMDDFFAIFFASFFNFVTWGRKISSSSWGKQERRNR